MATAAAVEDAVTCCICFDVYRDPHVLPCLHTLCKPCIDQLTVRGRVECPECRKISDVRKIRKDFKTQSLIDKVVNSHCKECECFMCTSCEKTHKGIKVCRGHTVKAVKDIELIVKLAACVDQWTMEKTKITIKANKMDISIKSVQDEAVMQIELTNKHVDNLILDLEKKRFALVNEIREANEVSVQSLKQIKGFYDQLSREIQSKIDVLEEVIKGKHATSVNTMVEYIYENLHEEVIEIRKQVDSFDVQEVLPVKVHIDKEITSIDTGIKLERLSQLDLATGERSIMLYNDYSNMKRNRYKLQLVHSKDCSPNTTSISIIENDIWCAELGSGIQIYDKNMQLVTKIKHENYRYVSGLAEWCGDIIVSCSDEGLHQITQSGDYVQKITGGDFSDVCSNEEDVYGLMFQKNRISVNIFTYRNTKWTEKGKIPIKTDNTSNILDKLIVNANSFFISLFNENSIQKYSLEGELQQTFGQAGTLTEELNGPILSGVDIYDNLLISDHVSKQLKVFFSEKQTWHVVPVKSDFGPHNADDENYLWEENGWHVVPKFDLEPIDTVMDDNYIWVVAQDPGYSAKILKYKKICA